MLKSLLGIKFLQRLLHWLIATYVRWVRCTGRWEILNAGVPERFGGQDRPFIAAFWHGRMLMMPCLWAGDCSMNVLTSGHRDGDLVAGIVGHFGIGNLRGSSSRGGGMAMALLAQTLESGVSVAMTPDGPRGPAEVANPGVVALARYSGAPIVPVSTAPRRCWQLKSWDGFVIPLPFSGGVFCFGEPLFIPRGADAGTCAAARRELEDTLKGLGRQAEAALDRPVTSRVKPAAMTLSDF